MMLSSAPESTRAVTGLEQELTRENGSCRRGRVCEGVQKYAFGYWWLLPDIDQQSVQADRSTDKGSASAFSPSPPARDGCGLAALALDSPFSGEQLGSAEGRRGLLGAKGEKDCVAEPQNASPSCKPGFGGRGG